MGTAALALGGSVSTLAGLYVLLGIALAGVNPPFTTLVARLAPEGQRSAILNLVYVPLYLGGIAGPAGGRCSAASGWASRGCSWWPAGSWALGGSWPCAWPPARSVPRFSQGEGASGGARGRNPLAEENPARRGTAC
ncbi:MAG TPA: hypothetical protein VJT32_03230 [bacterium]|nr:hypothetical protein [bacterium]